MVPFTKLATNLLISPIKALQFRAQFSILLLHKLHMFLHFVYLPRLQHLLLLKLFIFKLELVLLPHQRGELVITSLQFGLLVLEVGILELKV